MAMSPVSIALLALSCATLSVHTAEDEPKSTGHLVRGLRDARHSPHESADSGLGSGSHTLPDGAPAAETKVWEPKEFIYSQSNPISQQAGPIDAERGAIESSRDGFYPQGGTVIDSAAHRSPPFDDSPGRKYLRIGDAVAASDALTKQNAQDPEDLEELSPRSTVGDRSVNSIPGEDGIKVPDLPDLRSATSGPDALKVPAIIGRQSQRPPVSRDESACAEQQCKPQNQKFIHTWEAKNVARPQDQFRHKIDNSRRPFQPIIREKPNALVPLRSVLVHTNYGRDYYSHPYEHELRAFQIDPGLLSPVEPSEPPDLDSTPLVFVETVEQLEEMCRHIEGEKEFAVDLEHHSYRSFQGLTCLVQLSTRSRDFIVDAIKLRDELYRLNRSFTDPTIVKVFHGGDCDVLWLQRDFGVYVVNLFDTSRAARVMEFAGTSFGSLMKHYCKVEPDKYYQLADWRQRPLTPPMLHYARADTHYLLYIYDRLRNDLLGQSNEICAGADCVREVFEKGRKICLRRYEKPLFSETSHQSVLKKSRLSLNAKQMHALKELYAWRDTICRDFDESFLYAMPNSLMIRIAKHLPRERQEIAALCRPMPPLVKKHLNDIHAIILRAIDIPSKETSEGASAADHFNVESVPQNNQS